MLKTATGLWVWFDEQLAVQPVVMVATLSMATVALALTVTLRVIVSPVARPATEVRVKVTVFVTPLKDAVQLGTVPQLAELAT